MDLKKFKKKIVGLRQEAIFYYKTLAEQVAILYTESHFLPV